MKKLLLILLTVMLLVSCSQSNGSDADREEKVTVASNSPQHNATAIQGCAIKRIDGKSIVYSKKCESCGKISGTGYTTWSPGGTRTATFQCSNPKCKHRQKVEILCSKE